MKLTFKKLISLFGVLMILACSNSTSTEQGMGLLRAVDIGDSSKVEQLLKDGINPNTHALPPGQLLSGAFPLHLAIAKEETEIVKQRQAKSSPRGGRHGAPPPSNSPLFCLRHTFWKQRPELESPSASRHPPGLWPTTC